MCPNSQFSVDLDTFTEEILNGKLHFLSSATGIGKLDIAAKNNALLQSVACCSVKWIINME